MTSIETKLNEALDTIKFYERINTELKTEIHRLRLRDAQTQLEERISKLPEAAQERLRKIFPSTDIAGLKYAVKVEQRGAQ